LGGLALPVLAVGLGLLGLLLAWWAGSSETLDSSGDGLGGVDAEPAAPPQRALQSLRLLSSVLPVWQRGVEAARLESERGINCLLEAYAGVCARVERDSGTAATAPDGADRADKADKGPTEDMDQMLVGLQSQDRLSQMLVSTTDDMARCLRWLQGAEDPAAAQPALWLARLHASHTMDEMRAAHHDKAAVERTAAFELF
jgi:hypothetical protein